MTTRTRTLADYADEIHEVNVALGWFEADRDYGTGIALLHSEVSEAVEAWRDHGLADATRPTDEALVPAKEGELPVAVLHTPNPKPEGVGSELADVAIRALDMHTRHGNRNLDDVYQRMSMRGSDGPPPGYSVCDDLAAIHYVISMGYEKGEDSTTVLAALLIQTIETYAVRWGIDLWHEVNRKIAYNRTRPFQHGGRAV